MKAESIALYMEVLDSILPLRKPVTVYRKKRVTLEGCDCWGMYSGTDRHTVYLSTSHIKTELELFAVLSHEWVHCYQYDIGAKEGLDHDGELFILCFQYFLETYNINIHTMKEQEYV